MEYLKQGCISSEFIIKSSNKKNTIITGYASVFNIKDSHGHIISKGAFENTTASNVKLLWQHKAEEPIGIITSLEEDEYGLQVEAEINNNTRAGLEASELIKQRAVCGLSVGFVPKSSNYNKVGVRVIGKAKLMEISIVTFPANRHAEIQQIENSENAPYKQNSYNEKIGKLLKLVKQIDKY